MFLWCCNQSFKSPFLLCKAITLKGSARERRWGSFYSFVSPLGKYQIFPFSSGFKKARLCSLPKHLIATTKTKTRASETKRDEIQQKELFVDIMSQARSCTCPSIALKKKIAVKMLRLCIYLDPF
jgi:hypothetical protein